MMLLEKGKPPRAICRECRKLHEPGDCPEQMPAYEEDAWGAPDWAVIPHSLEEFVNAVTLAKRAVGQQ